MYMFLVGQVTELVENFNTGIFSDAIKVNNVKICIMVLHIELYLFVTFSMTLLLFWRSQHY